MRIPIVHTVTYADALRVKNDLKEEFPDKVFQIRKQKKTQEFTVVERVYHAPTNPEKLSPSKRRKKRRGISI